MAAPHVTGAVALLLSSCAKKGAMPDAAQISKALITSTRGANGQWDRGSGYGLIDTVALLQTITGMTLMTWPTPWQLPIDLSIAGARRRTGPPLLPRLDSRTPTGGSVSRMAENSQSTSKGLP